MSVISSGQGLTRRQFIKTAAAMATVTAVTAKLSGVETSPLVAQAAGAGAAADVWYRGVCKMCMWGDCITQVRVSDGVVVSIEGAPDSPTNRGTLCPRGIAAIFTLYNPYRVKSPMKRTNPEKGANVDPKWAEISWEEALNTVAEKLKAARAKDPRTLVINTGFGQGETALRSPFARTFGTPNEVSSNGPLCAVHYGCQLTQANNPVPVADLQYCNYHITIGRHAGPNHGQSNGDSLRVVDAVMRGMKLVVVDPRASAETRLGEWVPIRPGTDLAFTLSMIHVILHELGTYDNGFLKTRTNAPYLIGADGYYVRDAQTKKPLILDAQDGKAKPFDDTTLKDPALEGSVTVGGATVQPAFQLVKARMKEFTPEWAEPIDTVPPQTVRRIAKEFVEAARIGSTIVLDGFTFPLRPASIVPSRGSIQHKNGAYLDLTTKMLNMLIGSMDVPGGNLGGATRGPVLAPDEDGVVKPAGEAVGVPWKFPPDRVDMGEFYPNKHTAPHLTYKAIDDPKSYYLPYEVQVLWGFGGNSIRSTAGAEVLTRAIKKIPFVFQTSYHFDEMAELSDILLPEHSMLERMIASRWRWDNCNAGGEMMNLNMMLGRPGVPAIHNTRQADEIILDLAGRAGLLLGEKGLIATFNSGVPKDYQLDVNKRPTLEQIYDSTVKAALGAKATFQELKTQGYLKQAMPLKNAYNYSYFPGSKTRHPFYFNHLKSTGEKLKANLDKVGATVPKRDMKDFLAHYQAIPVWLPPGEFNAPPEYDLFVINYKVPLSMFGLGALNENPWVDEIVEQTDPYSRVININRATAAKKGLKDGEEVWIESRQGKVRGKLKTSELFHPDVVGIAGYFSGGTMHMNPIALKGPHYNMLISFDDNTFEPVQAGVEISPKVKIYRA